MTAENTIEDARFKGKRLGDMSREELLEALDWCYQHIRSVNETTAMNMRFQSLMKELKAAK